MIASASGMFKPQQVFVETTNGPEATEHVAAQLASSLGQGHVVLLQGPLGAGKTAFVRGLCRGLGFSEPWEVDSPTYTIVNHYPVGAGVDHLDLYRFSDPYELEEIGFDEMLASPSIVVIEWPERLADIPETTGLWLVQFEILGEQDRRITVQRMEA